MNITASKMTGKVARKLRDATGLSQTDFWGPIGVTQFSAARYENEISPMPRSVRILLVIRYVAGLELDAETPSGVKTIAGLSRG